MRAPLSSLLQLLHIIPLLVTLTLQIECCTQAFTFQRGSRQSTAIHGYSAVIDGARRVVPQQIKLDILYEDSDVLVINKPPGMVMQFVPGSVESAVVHHINSTTSSSSSAAVQLYNTSSWPWKSQESYEGIVHRLDKETSGIVIVAKNPVAATAVSVAFQERLVRKVYLAIAVGLPMNKTIVEKTQRLLEDAEDIKPSTKGAPNGESPPLADKPHLKRLAKEIKNCGRNAEKALKLINECSDPSAASFSAAISVCKRAGQRDTAIAMFDSMKERGVTPDTACFTKIMSVCSKGESPLYDKTMELVVYMKECNLPMDPYCLCSIISVSGRVGYLEPALELLASLAEERTIDADGMLGCFKAAISACEKCGATDSAIALKEQLRAMSGGKVEPHERTYTKDEVARSLNEEIIVDAPIGKMGRLMAILPKSRGGRESRSIITPLAFDGSLSLNRVQILTGRTHQIRIHMKSVVGCPLVGDRLYNRDDPIEREAERCMLHAAELELPHPTTGEMLQIFCPPPPDFAALAEAIGENCIGSI